MDSRKHRFAAFQLLLVCLFALVAAGPVVADPDYKQLKAEISEREKAVQTAKQERSDADTKLNENRAAQQKATGADLDKLKTEAKALAKTAGAKADALATAQQSLASKQGELRETAAAHAVKQLSAAGDIEGRVGEATNALDDWDSALGTLPDVPNLRPLDGIIDPVEQKAIRADDKKALEAFDSWASAEEARVDKEIKQADEIIKGESKWNASKDGGAVITSTAKSLKSTLETRKKAVGELRKTTKDRLNQIK